MVELQAGTDFVGRDHELRELLDGLDQAAAGRGRLWLVRGEPGIGKSRLAAELADRTRARGHRVLWGRAWEDAGAAAYWPWILALRAYVRATDPTALRAALGPGAADVAQILPELRTMFQDVPRSADTDPESARFQLFDSTATLLRNAARTQPLLIVLDDLQSADTASVLLLQFVASQLADMSALIVGTLRDVELGPDHPLAAAVEELAREPVTRTMTLRGLDESAVAAFIGAATNAPPRDHLVAAVWRETNGNPLFVGEAMRLLSAEGKLNDVADVTSLRVAVPTGIRAVIARRIDHLGPAIAELLLVAAVLGPEFSLEALRRVGEYEGGRPLDLIEDAVRAGLLAPVSGTFGRYRFAHDLVRETLYAELSPAQRAGLHRRSAEVLEELYAVAPEAHLAELAYHFVEAILADLRPDTASFERDAHRASEYARRAGDAATASLAYEEAARLYRMALGVLDLAGRGDEHHRGEVLLALGDVQARAGDLDDARSALLEAADVARRIGDASQLARAALAAGGRQPWTRAGPDTRLIPLLQDALVMLGGDDDRLRARLLTRLACAWRSAPERRDDSAAMSRQAVELARASGDLATLSYALTGQFWATWWPENPEARIPVVREVAELAAVLGDGERIADAQLMGFLSAFERGDIVEAERKVDVVQRLIAELRQPSQLWLGMAPRTELALLCGDFDAAEASIDADWAFRGRVTPGRDNVSATTFHRFLLRREQGRLAAEEALVRAAVDGFPWYPCHRAALVCLLVDLGRRSEAAALFAGLAQDSFLAIYRDNEWFLGLSVAADACTLLDDAPAAQVLYGQLAPFAGRHAAGHAEGSVGAVDRYLGLLAATMGRLDAAADHLVDAIRVNEAMGARPWTAHSQHDLAEVLRRRNAPGDLARAADLDRIALGTAQHLGMALAGQVLAGIAAKAAEAEGPGDVLAPSGGELEHQSGTPAAAVFRRDGEYWTIRFESDAFTMRDARGMRHIARLLESPGRELHALDLARADAESRSAGVGGFEAVAGDPMAGAGPILDAEAKAAYRQRIGDLQADLAEAEAWNDPERAARVEAELDALTHQLAAAMGLGGRDRSAGAAAERARVSVTRAIRSSLERIGRQSQSLGAHLDATVRTGTFCSYVPDPRAPIIWQVRSQAASDTLGGHPGV